MRQVKTKGFYLEGEIQNYFKNNLPVVIAVTACSSAGRGEQTLAFYNEDATSLCAQGHGVSDMMREMYSGKHCV